MTFDSKTSHFFLMASEALPPPPAPPAGAPPATGRGGCASVPGSFTIIVVGAK
jgi:hypothetical protein